MTGDAGKVLDSKGIESTFFHSMYSFSDIHTYMYFMLLTNITYQPLMLCVSSMYCIWQCSGCFIEDNGIPSVHCCEFYTHTRAHAHAHTHTHTHMHQCSHAYVMSMVIMVNEKWRERVPAWDVFESLPANFPTFFMRVLDACLTPLEVSV